MSTVFSPYFRYYFNETTMNFIKKYYIFVFAFAFLFISYLPNFYELSLKNYLPPDRTMIAGEHIYTYDYNVYLSKIRQGQEGRFTVVDKYDNHPQQRGVFLQIFYLYSGKVTKLLNLSPAAAYQIIRMSTSVIWIMTIIFLNLYFLKNLSLANLGVTLSFLAASFPVFYQFQNQWWIKSYMDWWQELDVLKRVSFIPHDTANYIFIGIFTVLMSLIEKNKKYFTLLSVLVFISVFIHPASSILFMISWVLYQSVRLIWSKPSTKSELSVVMKQTLVLFMMTLVPLFYIRQVTLTYPWKSLLDFDYYHRGNLDTKEYILALGPIFFTGLAGALLVIIKRRRELLGLVTWVVGAAVAIFLFKFFPYQTELRFVQTANHIPLAILTAYLISYLIKKSKKTISIYSIYITTIAIIVLGIAQTYYSLKAQYQFIEQRALASLPMVPYPPQVMYPLTDFYNGLKWLDNNTDHSSVVLSKVTAGNYIPAYSGNFVYLGHGSETPHYDARVGSVDLFFSGTLSDSDAEKFLKNENITYVFYGPQEKENNIEDIKKYPFLKPVYQSNLVIIYKVAN